jgi:hypothetical protein
MRLIEGSASYRLERISAKDWQAVFSDGSQVKARGISGNGNHRQFEA